MTKFNQFEKFNAFNAGTKEKMIEKCNNRNRL